MTLISRCAIALVFAMLFLSTSCNNEEEIAKDGLPKGIHYKTSHSNIGVEPVDSSSVKESVHQMVPFKKEDIARYTIAAIMQHPPSIIKAKKENYGYSVWYKRPEDNQRFGYKVYVENSGKIIWGNDDGRWRTDALDEKISYVQTDDEITIIQTFDDGSMIKDTYKRGK